MSNKLTCPFYAHPMGQKRSMQIIKEAKAEIKKMELRRPITPFGGKKMEKEHYGPVISRPSSSSSLKSFKYEQEEDCTLPARKTYLQITPKGKQKDSTDLKLEPLVTRSVLSVRKPTASLTKSQSQTDIVFPPITSEDKIKDNITNTDKPINSDASLCIVENNFPVDIQNNIADDETKVAQDILRLNICSVNSEPIENSTCEEQVSDELSQELKRFLFLLDRSVKTGRTKCEEEHIVIISRIHNLLKDNNAFQSNHPQRVPLLKLLFKFLDSNLPVLSMHTIKLLLEMKVRDKNLGCIFRLLLRCINSQKVNLEEYELFDLLFEAVEEATFESSKEAVLYGVVIIKSLLQKKKLHSQYIDQCLHILLHHLQTFNNMHPTHEERCDDVYIDLNKQIYSTLHSLTTQYDEIWSELLSWDNFSQMLKGLRFFYQNCDVIEIIVRLIGKVIDREDGHEIFAECPEDLLSVFPLILRTHMHHIGIMLQTTFIIGNVLLVDKALVQTFLNLHNLHNILIQILDEYVKEHIQVKITLSSNFVNAQGDCSDDHDWRTDISEVILKVLGILGNICLNTEAGCFLAQEKEIIFQLLNMIAAYLKHDTIRGPILSFLVVIGNISYYLSSESEACLRIAKRVVPLLHDSFSFEIRRESANIVQNLTRSSDVRKYIREFKLLPAFLELLSENDRDFNASAYGIIMNLLLDESNQGIFYEEEGVSRILHKLHLCTDRDWKMSARLCQILWNYCKGLRDDRLPISQKEAAHLIKYLHYSTGKEEEFNDKSSDYYLTWKDEFCPVAKKLLLLLQSNKTTMT